MANTLSKTGITNGQTIQPSHVTQSIDAFTGTEAYDITLSGSLTLTGSHNIDGLVTATSFSGDGSQITGIVSSSYALTASYAENAGGGAGFPFTGSAGISGSVLINSQLQLGVGPGTSGLTPAGNTYNIALGSNNLQNNTTGFFNVAIGLGALSSNTEGDINVALGVGALYYNTTGYSNVALGVGALYYNTTGLGNVALGRNALYNNTAGTYNTALGRKALLSNITGSFNSGLGYNVQSGNYSGSVMLGAGATATKNGQLALGSSTYPIGPVATENKTPNKTLEINLNGALYKVCLYKA